MSAPQSEIGGLSLENTPAVTPLPYDPASHPGVAQPTVIVPGQLSGPTVDARDTQGEQATRLAGEQAAWTAAMSSGEGQENDRRDFYASQIAPLSATTGIEMVLPPVPSAAFPPQNPDLYFKGGDEPEDWSGEA